MALKADRTLTVWGYYLSDEGFVPATVPVGMTNIVGIAAYGHDCAALLGMRSFPPYLVLQPQSQVAAIGSNVSFTVTASGTALLSYQWRKAGLNVAGGTDYAYTIDNVQLADALNYDVIVTNSLGAITSQVATLTVIAPPSISVQPQSQTAVVGSSVTFSVTAGGTAPHYQWQCNGYALNGATTSTYTINNVQPTNAGNYTVGITNPVGSVTSAVAVLAVLAGPPTVVVGWGANDHNQITIPVGLTNVVGVAAGGYHSLALKTDGTVVVWGKNMVPGGGDAGDATVPGGLVNVVAVAAGACHSLALKGDRTVVAWGYNGNGQTNVPSGLTNVVAVAAGYAHSMALKSDGTVVAWGYSGFGLTTIADGLANVIEIAAGAMHSLALTSDGTLIAWGSYGGSAITKIYYGLTNVTGIAAGFDYSLALKNDGTLVA
jgi:hypothetical protein